jgi:ribonucleoside-triphosphate reductase
MKLTSEFLAPYYAKGDCFPDLLARCTYLTKYCRDNETWTDTIRRVVEGNINKTYQSDNAEAEALFDLFWNMRALPPGRGLWTGGVAGIPAAAVYNCHYTTIRSLEDWCFTADQLMLGGGVGVGLGELGKLPSVVAGVTTFRLACAATHPNVDEVHPDVARGSLIVEDSRTGWIDALRAVLVYAFNGLSLTLDIGHIRARGTPISTFGGVACGPGPLATMLRSVWKIVRGAQGRKLTSVEALDITNYIGLCVKSGNVRRSALIVLGEAHDQEFRDAKKDYVAVLSHRHTSNNSIVLRTAEDVETLDTERLVHDAATYGEPGVLNLHLIQKTDPDARGINPCGEIPLHDHEACNLAEMFPARSQSVSADLRLLTRYAIRQRLVPVTDPEADATRTKNMRIGVGLGGVCDSAIETDDLVEWRWVVRREANIYADQLGIARPVATTTVKPSGTISLLNGSSPGMHAPYAPYYIRRVRIAKNDKMAPAMISAGVPCEDCVYDQTKQTWVFSFPCAKPNAVNYVVAEDVYDQIKRQAWLQENWADNAVSATISFREDEKEHLAELLKDFLPRLKSTSCLPKAHGYAQAPYEEITREDYESLIKRIDMSAKLTHGGDMQVEECEGGACPVR